MSPFDELLNECEARIEYQFRDRMLLRRCLTHSSWAETRLDSNERLEFLGDAVLGLVICEHLFQNFPEQREGQLTQMKSWLVSRQTCARVAKLLDLRPMILVGRGLQSIPESVLSAVVEAIVAGIYIDGGLESARTFILKAFREELALCRPVDTENFKSQLQEYTQRELGKTPEYVVVSSCGPDHAREFSVAARVGDSWFHIGRGRSKKEAEQQAARNAVQSLQQNVGDRNGSDPEGGGDLTGTGLNDVIEVRTSAEICIDSAERQSSLTVNSSGWNSGFSSAVTESLYVSTSITCEENSVPYLNPNGNERKMKIMTAEILLKPATPELRFLPEGPYSLGNGAMSWVGIQHGAEATTGSVNVLDLKSGTNRTWNLPGRPGFAFPTNNPDAFVCGVERAVGFFHLSTGEWTPFTENIDASVENTIINDAVIFEGNLIFGCKELEFKTPKAGLYLWRRRDRSTIQLRSDQICSNGKAVVRNRHGGLTLFDIDSCTKTIVRYELNIEKGTTTDPEVVVDLSAESVFPDGMILTPDRRSLIVALYDPGDPAAGVARQYSLNTGELEAVWECPGSPRVTCPQLIEHQGRVRLVLTTAVEHMSPEQYAGHPAAGCLFIADTSFDSIGDQPFFEYFAV